MEAITQEEQAERVVGEMVKAVRDALEEKGHCTFTLPPMAHRFAAQRQVVRLLAKSMGARIRELGELNGLVGFELRLRTARHGAN